MWIRRGRGDASANIAPTEMSDFAFLFAPATGSTPGPRSATMQITISNGETVMIPLTGVLCARELVATPPALFQNEVVPVGTLARRNATITNTGTFPVRVSGMTITGAGRATTSWAARPRWC